MADLKEVCASKISMRLSPDDNAEQSNEILYGESLKIIDQPSENWLQIKLIRDGYEGFVKNQNISEKGVKTHRVNIPLSHLYAVPDFKSPAPKPIYFLSQIELTQEKQDGFAKTVSGHWIFDNHLVETSHKNANFVDIALMFLGAAYLWGGRTINGIDCSGLVQISLQSCDIDCPRDTSQQISAIGSHVEINDIQHGDIVFFKGHVGIMVDKQNILNATARSMDTRIETLENLIKAYGDILAIKRIR